MLAANDPEPFLPPQVRELVRRSQQGHGRPIISAEVGDFRFVAVGNTLHHGKHHKTFPDFLGTYIKQMLGSAWGNGEIAKPLAKRHPVMQWYDAVCRYQNEQIATPGEVTTSPAIGVVSAYYGLAYNLYLLDHNVAILDHLVRRLKNRSSFYGAYYESFVAAWFILAGFTLTLENEDDPTVSHCEFVAQRSGDIYSVEAKTRAPDKATLDIGNQLYGALRKQARHPRIVFVDLNVMGVLDENQIKQEAIGRLDGRETTMTIGRRPAPPAYVFITNQPYHLQLHDEDVKRTILLTGFRVPDLHHSVVLDSLIGAFKWKQKHASLLSLLQAFRDYRIPSTFDGELPEVAFGSAKRTFLIGHRYVLPDGNMGTLTTGTVEPSRGSACLAFLRDDGLTTLLRAELSAEELALYRRHPETFFGRVLPPSKNTTDPLDLFEFIYNAYRRAPREKLLTFLSDAPDLDELKNRSREELCLVYAERCTLTAMAKSAANERSEEKR